jgi:hypothetical protein
MRLLQLKDDAGRRRVARVGDDKATLDVLAGYDGVLELAREALRRGVRLDDLARVSKVDLRLDYDAVERAGQVRVPIDHPDPAHLIVSGTGITHLQSANARDAMHPGRAAGSAGSGDSDSMRMYRMGVDGGKPASGRVGVQPEWFYKGDGSIIVPPGAPLTMPAFALTGGEEAEIVGVYLVDDAGTPRRIGFVLGNEFSDHELEEQNYLYAAASKLRECSLGPELLVGDLPDSVRGLARVLRAGETLWKGDFQSGEDHMAHSIANLEHHHFKHPMFRRPGFVHCHFFGAAAMSYAAGVRAAPDDVFKLDVPVFGRPLRNTVRRAAPETFAVEPL